MFLYLFNKPTLSTLKALGSVKTKRSKIIALKELSLERKESECNLIIRIQIVICINASTRFQRITEESN